MDRDVSFATSLASAEEIYASIWQGDENAPKARALLQLRHSYNTLASFDPQWGTPSPQSLSMVLKETAQLTGLEDDDAPEDRVARILKHAEDSLKRLLQRQRTSVVRNRMIMPAHVAREFDGASVAWISRKPGRNIREKLSGNPYLLAVKRQMSNNSAENRLLKAFAIRLKELLSARLECFANDSDADETLDRLSHWLRGEAAETIDPWTHLPPNNTLLQNRSYRTIWDCWSWLQSLENALQRDYERLHIDWLNLLHWVIASRLDTNETIRVPEQPCCFDDEAFSITPELKALYGLVDQGANLKNFVYGRETDFRLKLFVEQLEIELEVRDTATKISCSPNKKEMHQVDVTISDSDGKSQTVALDLAGAEEICSVVLKRHSLSGRKSVAVASSEKEGPIVTDHAVFDMGSVYPRVATSARASRLPSRLLMQFWQPENGIQETVDLGRSKAIALRPEAPCVSILDLMTSRPEVSTEFMDSAATAFGAKLKTLFDVPKVTYLCPDGVNEFSLESIRKSLNLHFDQAAPLPRSIAAAFSWQSSPSFQSAGIGPGDCLAILDAAEDLVTVTPLVACKVPPRVKAVLGPEVTVTWERHPCIEVERHDLFSAKARATGILESQKCPFPDEIVRLIGNQGLWDDGDKLSWVNDREQWFTPKPVGNNVGNTPANSKTEQNLVMAALEKACKQAGFPGKMFVLQLPNLKNVVDLMRFISTTQLQNRSLKGLSFQPVVCQGGVHLEKLQQKVPRDPLWLDHLPDLSMIIPDERKGREVNFPLVRNKKIAPIRGHPIHIKIKETFDLPKDQPFYSFPLVQGKYGEKIDYVAELRSPQFPLSKNLRVTLDMTYTYGSDDPYTLTFTPSTKDADEIGFKFLTAKWEREDAQRQTDGIEAQSPKFPPRRTPWKLFRQHPGKKGEKRDLLDWIQGTLNRKTGTIGTDWKSDKNNKYFCIVREKTSEIFCHGNAFEDDLQFGSYGPGDKLYFSILPNKHNLGKLPSASMVSVENEFSKSVFRSIRFHVLTVWNNGHNLSEPQAPFGLDNVVKHAIAHCEELLLEVEHKFLVQKLGDLHFEAFFFLSCLHQDAPPVVFRMLDRVIDPAEPNSLHTYYRNIAHVIGTAKKKSQLNLLENVLNVISLQNTYHTSICLQVLGIAIWRSAKLVQLLSCEQIIELSDKLRKALRREMGQLVQRNRRTDQKYVSPYIIWKLELLLGLLRTRESEDDEIKKLLVPGNVASRDFTAIVRDITEKILDARLTFESRIQLELKDPKPNIYRKTPDLLYALKLYLTGDTGAGSIRISGVQESEQQSE